MTPTTITPELATALLEKNARRSGHGCRDLLIYSESTRCHHSARLNGDWLADDIEVRSLCSRMVCTQCGLMGADVRPDWSPHVNKRHV